MVISLEPSSLYLVYLRVNYLPCRLSFSRHLDPHQLGQLMWDSKTTRSPFLRLSGTGSELSALTVPGVQESSCSF